MKILYYCWDEITSYDIMDVFKRKGYEVTKFDRKVNNYIRDEEFASSIEEVIKQQGYDCIFSFDYFPVISDVAERLGIKYVSWVYDSPNLTLMTRSVFNKCNYLFLFDEADVMKLKNIGVKNVFHQPLAVNMDKIDKVLLIDNGKNEYVYDVSFMGTMYNDKNNSFDQINMPEYYKGFFDGIIRAQRDIYGYDLTDSILDESFEGDLKKIVTYTMTEDFVCKDLDIFKNFLRKKITVEERYDTLRLLSEEGFKLTHFAPIKDERLDRVTYGGYLEYDNAMPRIFKQSKINLNISLRTILTGIPLRCMDIMGAGGFLLSNYQIELGRYFENGTEMVMYDSRIDMLDKVYYYLKHDEERIDIAKNGQKKIRQEFTYDIVLDKIFEAAGIM